MRPILTWFVIPFTLATGPLSYWFFGRYAEAHALMRQDIVSPQMVDKLHLASMGAALPGFVLSGVVIGGQRRWWRLSGLPGLALNGAALGLNLLIVY